MAADRTSGLPRDAVRDPVYVSESCSRVTANGALTFTGDRNGTLLPRYEAMSWYDPACWVGVIEHVATPAEFVAPVHWTDPAPGASVKVNGALATGAPPEVSAAATVARSAKSLARADVPANTSDVVAPV